MREYTGKLKGGGFPGLVVVSEGAGGPARPLRPRQDLYNHSPDGFSWGYHGSGCAQLALALLADHFAHDGGALERARRLAGYDLAGVPESQHADRLAVTLHQVLKRDMVARFDQRASWRTDAMALNQWLSAVELRTQAAAAAEGGA